MLDKDESANSKLRCYTTSCKACVFVEDLVRSPCNSCDADDTECMIAYGQCVKEYMRFITVTVSTSHYCMHIIEAYIMHNRTHLLDINCLFLKINCFM